MADLARSTEIVSSPKVHIMRTDVYHKFYNDLSILEEFEQKDGYYKVFQDDNDEWWLYLKTGFQHNGADCFPDYDYMIFPSAVHDVGLWLIDWGIIPERNNNLVDKELGDCIRYGSTPLPRWKGGNSKTAKKFEAWKIERATHLARTKKGEKGSLEFLNKTIPI